MEADWEEVWETARPFIVAAVTLSAIALSGLLASMEAWKFWDVRIAELRSGVSRDATAPSAAQIAAYVNYQFATLVVLWAIFSATLTGALCSAKCRPRFPEQSPAAAFACYVVTAFVFLAGCESYGYADAWLALNWAFISRIAVIAVLWWGAGRIRTAYSGLEEIRYATHAAELAGHFLLVVLLALEMRSWSQHTQLISRWLGEGIVSALWAAQAFALIWMGLITRVRLRRYAGLALFATAILKIVIYDTRVLETVYRIISWLGTGILLLAASYFYHQYTLAESVKKDKSPEPAEIAP